MAEVTNRKSTVDEKISKVIEKHTKKVLAAICFLEQTRKKKLLVLFSVLWKIDNIVYKFYSIRILLIF